MTELSIILISKNQEWNIGRLVESVLRETHHFPSSEIMLVDSASTDQTVEIASRYPISILKLYPNQRLTAGAGRFVGIKQTSGEFLLFLDGDMELCNGWLRQALDLMHSKNDIGVVCGRIIERSKNEQEPTPIHLEPTGNSTIATVRQGGGAAMYRRSVLQQVGSFNPYLYSDEEPDVCLRIRHADFRILRLSHPIAFHYSAPSEAFSTLLGRRSRKLWLGYGQNVRYYLGTPLLWSYIRERGWAISPALGLCGGIIATSATIFLRQWVWIVLWLALVILCTSAIAIQKRSLKRAFFTIFQRLLILEGTIKGFLLEPLEPSTYPGKFDVIQT